MTRPPKPGMDPARSTPDPAPMLTHNVMLGITLKITSVLVFLAMVTMIKATRGIPTGEVVFARSFFAIFPIAGFLAARGQLATGLKTKRLGAHLVRGCVGVLAMSSVFFALTRLPLPETIAITYATPLLLVALSALLLGEQVRLYRWSAVLIGLTGVVVIIWPRLTLVSSGVPLAGSEAIGALAALLGATLAAAVMLLVRRLVETERSATIVLYFSVISSVLAALSLPFGWVWPTPGQAALLIGAGIFGGIGQVLLTESFRHADMSVIAPFEYTSMVFGIGVGYVLFAEIPTIQMLFGGLIVIAAGIFIILREHRLGLERARARRLTGPQI